jgi:hypothetical protein
MNASNHVYAVFGSGVQEDIVTAELPAEPGTEHNFLRGHIFATWSRDGENWSAPMNLTPNGVDSQWPSLANLVDDEMHIAYQADTYPGDLLTSAGAGGSTLHPNIESVIMAYVFPVSSLPEPGTGSVRDEMANVGGAVIGAYPNPTSGRTQVVYSLDGASKVEMRIVNTLGESVVTLVDGASLPAGRHAASFDASSLTSGSYFVMLTIDGNVTVSPMNVAR